MLQWRAIVKSIEVSRISAEAAKKSTDLALSELRAWGTIQTFERSEERSESSHPLVTIEMQNTGRTPAVRMSYGIAPVLAINEDALAAVDRAPSPPADWGISPGHLQSKIWRDVVPLSAESLAFYSAK